MHIVKENVIFQQRLIYNGFHTFTMEVKTIVSFGICIFVFYLFDYETHQ